MNSVLSRLKPVLFLAVVVMTGLGAALHFRSSNQLKDLPELKWALLATAERDFLPPELASKLESRVRIGGFVVPLTDAFQDIREFLLVPDSMSCIHVPPPPSNQMLLVRFRNPIDPQLAFGPVWVFGDVKYNPEHHAFGEAYFLVEGIDIVPFASHP